MEFTTKQLGKNCLLTLDARCFESRFSLTEHIEFKLNICCMKILKSVFVYWLLSSAWAWLTFWLLIYQKQFTLFPVFAFVGALVYYPALGLMRLRALGVTKKFSLLEIIFINPRRYYKLILFGISGKK